jgi:hypothetical protein
LNESLSKPRLGETDGASGIARIVRRICLLREQGDSAEAGRLEREELATAVRESRLAGGPETPGEQELGEIYARESRRIADAVVIAEILATRLAPAAAAPRPAPGPSLRAAIPAVPRPAGSGTPAIPELLDAMLDAERSGRRRAPRS